MHGRGREAWSAKPAATGRAAWLTTPAMPAPKVSARRWNPVLRDFYQHLVAKRKPAQPALATVIRKLRPVAPQFPKFVAVAGGQWCPQTMPAPHGSADPACPLTEAQRHGDWMTGNPSVPLRAPRASVRAKCHAAHKARARPSAALLVLKRAPHGDAEAWRRQRDNSVVRARTAAARSFRLVRGDGHAVRRLEMSINHD